MNANGIIAQRILADSSSRFSAFTNNELSAIARAMRVYSSPLLGTLPDEVEAERIKRTNSRTSLDTELSTL